MIYHGALFFFYIAIIVLVISLVLVVVATYFLLKTPRNKVVYENFLISAAMTAAVSLISFFGATITLSQVIK